MWQPEPGWHPLPGGHGTSTAGVWRTVLGGRPVAIKRLTAPTAHDPAELADPHHAAYWRRPADVVTARLALDGPGLRAPVLTSVEEDEDGITLVQDWVEDAANSGLFGAHALGRFVRLDPSRGSPGAGLGLALVAAVARMHGAEIILGDNAPGLRATLRFAGEAQPEAVSPSP